MRIANASTHTFEFDQCCLIEKALSLNAFRIMKNKSTKKPDLIKLVQAAIRADQGENSRTTQFVLALEEIQLCFAKSKMHHVPDSKSKDPARDPPQFGFKK